MDFPDWLILAQRLSPNDLKENLYFSVTFAWYLADLAGQDLYALFTVFCLGTKSDTHASCL